MPEIRLQPDEPLANGRKTTQPRNDLRVLETARSARTTEQCGHLNSTMNRRMRDRTSGGVGGREPRGSLLPDEGPARNMIVQLRSAPTDNDARPVAHLKGTFQAPNPGQYLLHYPTRTGALLRVDDVTAGAFDHEHKSVRFDLAALAWRRQISPVIPHPSRS